MPSRLPSLKEGITRRLHIPRHGHEGRRQGQEHRDDAPRAGGTPAQLLHYRELSGPIRPLQHLRRRLSEGPGTHHGGSHDADPDDERDHCEQPTDAQREAERRRHPSPVEPTDRGRLLLSLFTYLSTADDSFEIA